MDLSRDRLDLLIEQHIFNERDRRVLRRRWFDKIKFEDLAEEFELSVRWVKNIVYSSEKILTKYI
jgi:hypothetical protein